MIKRTDQEVKYRLAKWVIMNLEAEQLLMSDEIEAIWRELLSLFSPPTESVEVPCGSMLDPMQGCYCRVRMAQNCSVSMSMQGIIQRYNAGMKS